MDRLLAVLVLLGLLSLAIFNAQQSDLNVVEHCSLGDGVVYGIAVSDHNVYALLQTPDQSGIFKINGCAKELLVSVPLNIRNEYHFSVLYPYAVVSERNGWESTVTLYDLRDGSSLDLTQYYSSLGSVLGMGLFRDGNRLAFGSLYQTAPNNEKVNYRLLVAFFTAFGDPVSSLTGAGRYVYNSYNNVDPVNTKNAYFDVDYNLNGSGSWTYAGFYSLDQSPSSFLYDSVCCSGSVGARYDVGSYYYSVVGHESNHIYGIIYSASTIDDLFGDVNRKMILCNGKLMDSWGALGFTLLPAVGRVYSDDSNIYVFFPYSNEGSLAVKYVAIHGCSGSVVSSLDLGASDADRVGFYFSGRDAYFLVQSGYSVEYYHVSYVRSYDASVSISSAFYSGGTIRAVVDVNAPSGSELNYGVIGTSCSSTMSVASGEYNVSLSCSLSPGNHVFYSRVAVPSSFYDPDTSNNYAEAQFTLESPPSGGGSGGGGAPPEPEPEQNVEENVPIVKHRQLSVQGIGVNVYVSGIVLLALLYFLLRRSSKV